MKRHGQAASSGSKTKAPGSAGGYLLIAIDMLESAGNANGAPRIRYGETNQAALRLCNLSVTLEDGTPLVREAEVTIARGERVLLVGPSGTGKSSLVRAICGQWLWGQGEVQLQGGGKLFVVPQRPYIPWYSPARYRLSHIHRPGEPRRDYESFEGRRSRVFG